VHISIHHLVEIDGTVRGWLCVVLYNDRDDHDDDHDDVFVLHSFMWFASCSRFVSRRR